MFFLDIEKTIIMLLLQNVDQQIIIAKKRIREVTETKFLGAIIDKKFNWSTHITFITTKGIGIILKARKVFDRETLLTLHYTFVYS